MGKGRKSLRTFLTRTAGFTVALVMALSILAVLPEGILKVKASSLSTTITTRSFTISGKIGEYLEQEVVFESSLLDFNEKVLVPGFDLTEYLNYRSEYRYHNTHSSQDCYLDKPVGISCKVIGVDEENGKHLKALVYGTPLSNCYTKVNLHTCPKWFLKGYDPRDTVSISIDSYAQGKWSITAGRFEKTSVELSHVVIKGSVGSAVNAAVKLTLKNGFFSDYVDKGTDISDWFPGRGVSDADGRARQLPVGLSATLDSDIVPGSTTAAIKITGTPLYKSNNYLVVCIPGKYITGTNGSGSWFSFYYAESVMTDDCCFDISGPDDEPVYAAVDNVRYEVYAGTNLSSGGYNCYINDVYYTSSTSRPWYSNRVPAAFTVYNHSGGFKDGYKPNSNGTGFYKNENIDNGIFIGNPLAEDKEIGIIPFETLTCAYSAEANAYAIGYGMKIQTKSDQSAPFSVLGEYPLVISLNTAWLKNYTGESGFTPAIKTNAKLIVKSPYEFFIENAVISGEPGDSVDTNIVLVPGDASTFNVSEEKPPVLDTKELEKTGLKATVVSYAEDHIAVNLKGRLNSTGNPKVLLSDCIKLSADNISVKDAFKKGGIDVADYIPKSGLVDPAFSMSAFISVTGESDYTPCEIDYSERPDVILYPKDKSGKTVETTFINMTKETLTLGEFQVKAYSTDGGEKWTNKTTKLTTAKDFAKLLAKGMTLSIADNYDTKEKKPADSANILNFTQINKQAAKPKIKVDYLTYKDDSGATNGQFAMADNEGTLLTADALKDLEIGVLINKGKALDENGYGVWPESGGVTLLGLSSGKPQKAQYSVRTVATTSQIASKPTKLKVNGVLKAPSIKIDYKNETIKLKEGMTVLYEGKAIVSNIAKEDTSTPISISEYLSSEDRVQFKIFSGASAKKGATAPQRIIAAQRGETATSGAITLSKGKLKINKTYEAYNAEKKKWGGLPKIEESTTILIRKKATAKGGKESDSTFAASESMNLIVTCGTDAKGKTIVTAFDVQYIPKQ